MQVVFNTLYVTVVVYCLRGALLPILFILLIFLLLLCIFHLFIGGSFVDIVYTFYSFVGCLSASSLLMPRATYLTETFKKTSLVHL